MSGKPAFVALTTTRADFGLMAPALKALAERGAFEVSLIVGGTHLSHRHGRTIDEIRGSGLRIAAEIEAMGEDAIDDWQAAARFSASLMAAVADTLARQAPHFFAVLGDRYETLAGAQAAALATIPIVHLFGGDNTEGAIDNAFRHAITKLSALHFVASETSARRVFQMGEDPARIYNIGNPGLDGLAAMKAMSREQVLARLGLPASTRKIVLVTLHPVTLDPGETEAIAASVFAALASLSTGTGVVVTGVNADAGSGVIADAAQAFAAGRENVVLHHSLGHEFYLQCLSRCDLVAGNSSSGVLEAPALGVPAVNIGTRQAGRERSRHVIDAMPDRAVLEELLPRALALGRQKPDNLFGDGLASRRFARIMERFVDGSGQELKRKPFHELGEARRHRFPLMDIAAVDGERP